MSLKARILSLTNARPVEVVSAEQAEQPSNTTDSPLQGLTTHSSHEVPETASIARQGKAPPVELYTSENPDLLWEEWVPMFERAASWNGWTEQEKLLQLAGHPRSKALQEWNLLSGSHKSTFATATAEMQSRLDPGSKMVAVQEFRHKSQKPTELAGTSILMYVWKRTYICGNSLCPVARTIARRIEIRHCHSTSCLWGQNLSRVMHSG